MKIDISIIIATYNSAQTIRTALESVKNQTFDSWECIVVDGASKDNTIDIVKEFVDLDSRFNYISEPDNGIYDAFNKGWEMANGEWIYYLGSDDYLMPEGLNGLINSNHNADIIYGDMIYETGIKKKAKESISEKYLMGNMPCHQSMIMKKTIIQKFHGFNMNRYKICADFDLFQRALRDGVRVNHVPIYVACFNSMGASSGIKTYLKECYKIKKDNKGVLFAWNYIFRITFKRIIKKYIILRFK